MERIKTPTRVVDKWPGGPFGPRDGHGDGNPQTGESSTQHEARFYDSLQEEIATAIELAGIALRDDYPFDQLYQAIVAIAIANNPDVSNFVLRTGDTMTGPLGINHTGGVGLQVTAPGNADSQLRLINGSGTWSISAQGFTQPEGELWFYHNNTLALPLRIGVDDRMMLGKHPDQDFEAVTKFYVDSLTGGGPFLPLTGGTLENPGTLVINHPGGTPLTVQVQPGQDCYIAFNGSRNFVVGPQSTSGDFIFFDFGLPGISTRMRFSPAGDVIIDNAFQAHQITGGCELYGDSRVWGRLVVDDIESIANFFTNTGYVQAQNGFISNRLRVDAAHDFGVTGQGGFIDCTNGNAQFNGRVAVNDFESRANIIVTGANPNGWLGCRQVRINQSGPGGDFDPGLLIERTNEEPAIAMDNVGVRQWQIRVRRDGYFLIGVPNNVYGGAITFAPTNNYCNLSGLLEVEGAEPIAGETAFKPGGGPWGVRSDARLKRAIAPYQRGLDAIRQLRPITYQYNGRGRTHDTGDTYVGLMAEEVQSVMPEMVGAKREKLDPEDTEETDILTLNTNALQYASINAIKELAARVEALEGGRG